MDNDFHEIRELCSQMLAARARREAVWRELRRWICPWRGRFEGDADRWETSREDEPALFTGAASQAVLRGASGMTSGMTPRNVAWFKPVFNEPALMEAAGAREWLDLLDERMKDALARGGFYQAIQNFNIDLLWAGCALLYSEKSDDGLRFECAQIGSFCVSADRRERLLAVCRDLTLTARELAATFGEENLSRVAREKLNRNPFDAIAVRHVLRTLKGGRIESLWLERDGPEKFLRKSSFHETPYFFARWNEGATVYGTGPGDECLADARQMDLLERHKLAGIGKLADPPVLSHPGLKDVMDLEPGGITYALESQRVAPILDLSPYAQALVRLQEEIQNDRQRLDQGLMASVFSSLPLDQRPRDMSATEFLERKREALQQLGPIISAYEPNVLIPLLGRLLGTLARAGALPPLPDALKGVPLAMKIEFISPMANALRQTSAETTRALFQDVAAIFSATQNPEIFDKVNLDQIVDELARGIGAPGSVVRADEEVEQIRAKRVEETQAREQREQAMQAAELEAKRPPEPAPENPPEI